MNQGFQDHGHKGLSRMTKGLVSYKRHNVIVDALNGGNGLHSGQVNTTGVQAPFWARITASVKDGSNPRWFYSWKEVHKTPGYGGWVAVGSDGASGSASDAKMRAYNLQEDFNAVGVTLGNGIYETNIPDGFDVVPIPDNSIVLMFIVSTMSATAPSAGNEDFGGGDEFWFDRANGIDGTCT